MRFGKVPAQLGAGIAFLLAPVGSQAAPTPEHIPSSGGEVVLASPVDRQNYDQYHFAAIRRAGDLLFVSGVIVRRAEGEKNDVPAFKDQTRRAFRRIQASLQAAGADFRDVVMINTFHVWQSPNFAGTRDEQFEAFSSVKDEFLPPPHPAWTAVGTTGLLADSGIVEIQMIANMPAGGRH